MKLLIKNMVSLRCKMIVKSELEKLGLHANIVELGEVEVSEKLGYDYNYLSNLFSEVKGTTIEHYIISHKIERAKELLIYNELSLTEIAYKLHYSSVAHLSNQFKKITGLTPSFFKNMKHKRLIAHENL